MTVARDADRLVLLRELASGPLSHVWLAERRAGAIGRPVVAKVLDARFPRDVEILFGMRDRSRQLDAIGHPAIVCAEDVARVGGQVGLVYPWVDGIDLVDWVEALREHDLALPGRVVCEVVRGIASALDAALNRVPLGYAHPIGAIHRDLKPTNVMIDRDGDVRVLDFESGYTSIAGRGARAGALQKGLAKYLSPTRREGKRGGPPADVYALGIIAIELFRGRWLRRLAGQNPGHDRALAEVVARLGDVGLAGPDDDRALHNLLLRMVAYDPEARPNAADVLTTFRALGDRAPGPSLDSMAAELVVPWLEVPFGRPAPGVEPDVEVLHESSALPPLHERAPAVEETDHDWNSHDPPIDDDDDDDDVDLSLLTPAAKPRRPPLPPAPKVTPPPGQPREAAPRTPTPTPTPAAAKGRRRRRDPDAPPLPVVPLLLAAIAGALGGMGLLATFLAWWWLT